MSYDQVTNSEKFKTQTEEFDAVERLSKCYKNLTYTPIVDDDYPEMRHYYESAMHQLLEAAKKNGRIK